MHYFFYAEDQKDLNQKLSISKKSHNLLYHQMANVLKFKKGQDICLLNNSDFEFVYEISEINKNEFLLNLKRKEKNSKTLKSKVNLIISIPKKDKLEWIVQKAVELGVSEISPVLTERSIKQNINTERLKKISREAVEQCHGSKLIRINPMEKLENSIKNIKNSELNLILDTKGSKNIDSLKKEIKSSEKINLFIGPEGGFSDEELNILKKLENQHNILLGERILRLETAAILSMGLIIHYLSL